MYEMWGFIKMWGIRKNKNIDLSAVRYWLQLNRLMREIKEIEHRYEIERRKSSNRELGT